MGIRKSINGYAIAQKINIKMAFVMRSATSLSVFGMVTTAITSDQKRDITLIQGLVPKNMQHIVLYGNLTVSKLKKPIIDHLTTKALIILSWSWTENIIKRAMGSAIELGMPICL